MLYNFHRSTIKISSCFEHHDFTQKGHKTFRSYGSTTLYLISSTFEYIFLKVEYQLVKVELKDINFVEGLKDYVKVQLTDGKFILS